MDRTQITGVVLAGGLGRRMGGVDKGLQRLQGRTMIEWAVERLAPQVGALLINANQHLEQHGRLGYPVVPDAIPEFAGPLAGLHAALSAASTPFVVTVPCDSPFLPVDLVSRLFSALTAEAADLAIARTGTQRHPVFCLCRRALLPDLAAYLGDGQRRFEGWTSRLNSLDVAFDDQPEAFQNINTPQELALAEQQLAGRSA